MRRKGRTERNVEHGKIEERNEMGGGLGGEDGGGGRVVGAWERLLRW